MSQPGNEPKDRARRRAALRAEDYLERKTTERCTRPGCNRPPADGAQLCQRHLRKARRASARSMTVRRQRERDAGRCAEGCGRKSETYRCPVCVIRLGRIPRLGVNPGVNNSARPPGGVWRDDINGWHRYRGRGKPGAPPAGANDGTDLKIILDAIRNGTEALAYSRSPEVATLGRITRQAAKNEVAALFAHAARTLDDLVDRLRKGG